MIEIVYDEKNDATESPDRRYELPKNIRQVGNTPGNYKIYVEDYVMTYLRKMASPGNSSCRGAILLGKVYKEKNEKIIFISGAVDAQNLEFDINMISFGDSVWSQIYSEINKYFNDMSIVGWFLSRMGFSTGINEQMKKLHRDNFPGDDKVLFLMDALECEEAFYYYDHGSWVRERGYYIYYVRNEEMQNYIISRKNSTEEKRADRVVSNDKTVVESFREKNKDIHKKKLGFGQAVACFCAVCAVSLGALWYASPETLGRIGDKLIKHDSSQEVQVFMNSGYDGSTSAQSSNGEDDGKTDVLEQSASQPMNDAGDGQKSTMAGATGEQQVQNITDGKGTASVNDTVTDDSAEQATDNTTAADTDADTYGDQDGDFFVYTVEPGDTLVSIAIRMYGDQTEAEKIASANALEIDAPIYEGQKLVIPYAD